MKVSALPVESVVSLASIAWLIGAMHAGWSTITVQEQREALRPTGVDVELQVAHEVRVDRLAGGADDGVDLAGADLRLGRALESELAALIEAAVQYLPSATDFGLNFRPAKWILYVLTGFDRVPSSVPIV